MVNTRSANGKTVSKNSEGAENSEFEALQSLCQLVITETKVQGILKNTSRVAAAYYKLLGYRNRLVETSFQGYRQLHRLRRPGT